MKKNKGRQKQRNYRCDNTKKRRMKVKEGTTHDMAR